MALVNLLMNYLITALKIVKSIRSRMYFAVPHFIMGKSVFVCSGLPQLPRETDPNLGRTHQDKETLSVQRKIMRFSSHLLIRHPLP